MSTSPLAAYLTERGLQMYRFEGWIMGENYNNLLPRLHEFVEEFFAENDEQAHQHVSEVILPYLRKNKYSGNSRVTQNNPPETRFFRFNWIIMTDGSGQETYELIPLEWK